MLPNTLQLMDVFTDGTLWRGKASEVSLPTIARKLEEYSGGMLGTVELQMGFAALKMEVKVAGRLTEAIKAMGKQAIDGLPVRFMGAYQDQTTSQVNAVEIYVRGRAESVERGAQKASEVGEETLKVSCVYYREVENGETLVEIDVLNNIWIVAGTDLAAELRAGIGQ